jgi:flavin-dependent amine oxidoreductase
MATTNDNSAQSAVDFDVAIVGGGVSGIYSGWRLLTGDPGQSGTLKGWRTSGKPRVAVFEGSHRVGGRLLSARPTGFPETTTCEIGGMRYVSSQVLVRSLVENELKLPRYEQVVDLPTNIAYLRGKQLRSAQSQNPSVLPYDLDWAESQFLTNSGPSGLIGWAVAKLLPGVNTLTGGALHHYLREAIVDGTPLYQHGFWNLLARALSPDAYALSRALIGYDCLGSNANAVDLISEYFDFTPGVHYYLFNDGYDAVPWTLQQRFEAAGGRVICGRWLTGFDAAALGDGTTGVALRFGDGDPPVTARAIILAMPQRSIELLRRDGPVLDPARAPQVQHLLNSVRPIPLYKLFVAYEYPWWTAVGVSQGRSLTDTPVRQLYYWPVDPGAAKPPATGAALLMAYNDATNVDFWAGLTGENGRTTADAAATHHLRRLAPRVRMFDRRPPPASRGADPFSDRLRQNWHDHPAPHEMVKEMHRQIMRMHNIQYAPEPIDAAYMDWSIDPYGGGVHFWNRGYKSWEVLHRITQPVDDFPCYICGEAYSTNQTWVEGALQTAEIVLQKHLGLSKPTWVTPNPSAAGART